jgi:hypothetical protein
LLKHFGQPFSRAFVSVARARADISFSLCGVAVAVTLHGSAMIFKHAAEPFSRRVFRRWRLWLRWGLRRWRRGGRRRRISLRRFWLEWRTRFKRRRRRIATLGCEFLAPFIDETPQTGRRIFINDRRFGSI